MSRREPAPDSRSDEDLIAAMNGGDSDAFGELYVRHRDWVVRLAYRFTGERDDALDVLQETFRYFLGKFPGFRLTAKLTTFLYPAVRNLSIGLREKKRPLLVGDDVLEAALGPASGPHSRQRGELAPALATLSDRHREALLLRFVDDLRLEEIAVRLAIPVGTVKSRIHHALRVLRADPRTRRYFDLQDDEKE